MIKNLTASPRLQISLPINFQHPLFNRKIEEKDLTNILKNLSFMLTTE